MTNEPRTLGWIGTGQAVSDDLASQLQTEFKLLLVPAMDVACGELPEALAECDAVVADAASFAAPRRGKLLREVLLRLLRHPRRLRPITLVAAGDSESGRVAASAGAWDVVPVDAGASEIVERVRAAAALGGVERAASDLAASDLGASDLGVRKVDPPGEPSRLLGQSPLMKPVLRAIDRLATSSVPILLTGESGTGKELVATAIHARGPRAEAPLVPVNCAAIPDQLLESELFGHERGAFTGANRTRRGRLEAADGGTLLLDEIGEMAPALQVKLLRFLEDHTVERVGDQTPRRLDVRIVAATNRNLEEEVERGRFRRDLYYRLAVFTLRLPPLRSRQEDILPLARYYLDRYAREDRRVLDGFTAEAEASLLKYRWPGNVRELINRVRRAVVNARERELTAADLGFEDSGPIETLEEARRRAELRALRCALRQYSGNRTEVARRLGLSRTRLYELMHAHGLLSETKRP